MANLDEFALAVISAESPNDTYNAVNGGTNPNLQNMTVSDILEGKHQIEGKSSAAGAPQIMGFKLKELVDEGVVELDQKFDKDTQDKIINVLLDKRGRQKYKNGEISKDEFDLNISKEWAGIPVKKDIIKKTKKGDVLIKAGQSYYSDDGVNKATLTIDEYDSITSGKSRVVVENTDTAEVAGSEDGIILPSGLNKDSFDYIRYARGSLGDESINSVNDRQKEFLYKDAVTESYNILKKDMKLSEDDALKKINEMFTDGYETLGIARPKPIEEQRVDFTLEGFKQWGRKFLADNPSFSEMEVEDISKIYLDGLNKKNGYTELKDNGVSSAIKSNLKKKIKKEYDAVSALELSKNKNDSVVDTAVEQVAKSDSFFSTKLLKSIAVNAVEHSKQIPSSFKYNDAEEALDGLSKEITSLDSVDYNKEIVLKTNDEIGTKVVDLVAKIQESKDPYLSYIKSDEDYIVTASAEVNRRYNQATPEERKIYIDELKKESEKLFLQTDIKRSRAEDELIQSEIRIEKYDDKNFTEGQKILRDAGAGAPQAIIQAGAIALAAFAKNPAIINLAVAATSGLQGAQSGMQEKTNALRKGATLEEADRVRNYSAGLSFAGEYAGGKLLEPLVKAGGNIVKDTVKAMLGDGAISGVSAPIAELIRADVGLSTILNDNTKSVGQKATEMIKLAGHEAAVGSITSAAISVPTALSAKPRTDTEFVDRPSFTPEEIRSGATTREHEAGIAMLAPVLSGIENDKVGKIYLGVKNKSEYADLIIDLVGSDNLTKLVNDTKSINEIDKFNDNISEILKDTDGLVYDNEAGRYKITDINSKKQKLAQLILNHNNTKKKETTRKEASKPHDEDIFTDDLRKQVETTTNDTVTNDTVTNDTVTNDTVTNDTVTNNMVTNDVDNNMLYDANGGKHEYVYDVVDAAEVDGNIKKSDVQFRDRDREELKKQVDEIAENTDYDLLQSGHTGFDMGAPVLTKDGKVVAGNGRLLGIKKNYDGNTAYKEGVEADIKKLGLEEKASGIDRPILVRKLVNDVADIEKLAILTNKQSGASISRLEQASIDSKYVDIGTLLNDKGELDINPSALQGFDANDLNSLVVGGKVQAEGIERIKNVILFKAYGDSNILKRSVEDGTKEGANILKALNDIAPKVANINNKIESELLPSTVSISNDLVKAVDLYANYKNINKGKNKTNVLEFLSQGDLDNTITPSVEQLFIKIDQASKKPSSLVNFINSYYDKVDRLPPPSQGSLFGDTPKNSVIDIMRMAEPTFDLVISKEDGGIDVDMLNSVSDYNAVIEGNKLTANINGKKLTFFKGKNGKYTVNERDENGTKRIVDDSQTITIKVPTHKKNDLDKYMELKNQDSLFDQAIRFSTMVGDMHESLNSNSKPEKNDGVEKRSEYYEEADVVITEDNGVAKDGKGIEVPFDADTEISRDKYESTIFNVKYSTNVTNDGSAGGGIVKKADLEPYINALPQHIKDKIIFLDKEDNYLAKRGMLGGFVPDYNRNGSAILINLHDHENIDSVAKTIAHEINHFTWDSIHPDARPKKETLVKNAVEILYDNAWRIFKNNIHEDLPSYYFVSNKIDPNNPTTSEKQILLDEYFARYDMSLLDLKNGNINDLVSGEDKKKLLTLSDNARKRIVFDYRSRVPDADKDTAESFANKIMDIQRQVIRDKTVSMEILSDGRTVRITPTPFGAIRESTSRGGETRTEKYTRIQNDLESDLIRKVHYAVHAYLPMMNPLGDTIPHLISTAGQNTSKALSTAMAKPKLVSIKVGRYLSEKGITVDNLTHDSYTETFLANGLTSKKQLSAAKEADGIINDLKSLNEMYYKELRKNIREGKRIIINEAKKAQVSDRDISLFIKEISKFEAGLKKDWSHRQYRVHTKEGRKELSKMVRILSSSKAMSRHNKEVAEAKNRIFDIESKGNPSKTEYKELIRLKRVVNIDKRLASLKSYVKTRSFKKENLVHDMQEHLGLVVSTDSFKRKANEKRRTLLKSLGYQMENDSVSSFLSELDQGAEYKKYELVKLAREYGGEDLASNVDAFVTQYEAAITVGKTKKERNKNDVEKRAMISKIESIIRDTSSDNTDKLSLIPSSRSRKIDEDTQAGQDLIDFLEIVKDPLEIAVMNVTERSKMSHMISFHNRLFSELINTGGARVLKSIEQLSNTKAELSIGQEGSIIRYLSVDKPIRDILDKEIMMQNDVNKGVLLGTVAVIKKAQTVLNWPTMVTNYVGNTSSMLRSGKLLRLKNTIDAIKAVPELWGSSYLYDTKSGEKLTKKEVYMKELYDGGLLSTGAFQAFADNTKTDIIDDFISFTGKFLEKKGVVETSTVDIIRAYLDIAGNVAANVYTNGDVLPKILSYYTNRPLAIARYRAELKQRSGETKVQYDRRVLEAAIPEAIRLTRAETVDYSSVPYGTRKILRSDGIRLTALDYAMFPMVQLNIELAQISESYKAGKELVKYANDNSEEAIIYKKQLKSVLAHRIVGNAMVSTGAVASGLGLTSPLAYIATGLIIYSMSDDEIKEELNKPLKDRSFYATQDEISSAAKLLQDMEINGTVYTALPWRSGYKIKGINLKATVADYTWMPIIHEEDTSIDITKKMLKNIINTKPDDAIAYQLLSSLSGMVFEKQKDYYDRKMDGSQSVKKLLELFPQIRDINKLIDLSSDGNSKFSDADKITKIQETMLRYVGLRTKEFDLRRIAESIGYSFKDNMKKSQRPIIRKAYDIAESNRVVEIKSFYPLVEAIKKENHKLFSKNRRIIKNLQGVGMPIEEIRNNLQGVTSVTKRTKIAKKGKNSALNNLITGKENAYDLFIIGQIKRKIGKLKREKSVDGILTRNQIDNQLANYQNLLSVYLGSSPRLN